MDFSIGQTTESLTKQDSIELGLIDRGNPLEFDQRAVELMELRELVTAGREEIEKLQSESDGLEASFLITLIVAIILLMVVIYMLWLSRKRNKNVLKLESTVSRARRALEEREKFLAYTNHEIRTPLNAVSGSARLLQNTSLSPKQEKYVHTIRASVDNVLILVNDVLDLSRLESGKIDFQSTDFMPWEIMQGVKYILQEKVDTKGISFDLELDPKIPPVLKGDPGHLNQILLNLANNAVKFTDLGSVKLKTILKSDEGDTVRVRFEIIDTGKGIRKSKLPTIFNQYEQETRHTIKHKGGSGLGLSITRQLVELQGGMIDVKSKYMEGTTFIVELDFGKSKKKTLNSKEGQTADVAFMEGLKVMVVDDNELNREIMKDLLEDCNPKIETVLVDSGETAVEYLHDKKVDMILMDIQMPKMNGFETTEYIRKNVRSPLNEIPIIAMTAYALEDAAQKCFEAGMNDYITKPVDPNFLVTKMGRLVSKKGFKKGQGVSFMYVNLAKLKELTSGDNTKMFKYIDLFLKNVPEDLEKMRNATKESDWENASALAHKIKGNAGYMGIEELERLYERIESVDLNSIDRKERKQLLNDFMEVGELSVAELKKVKSDYKLLFLDIK